MAYGGLGGLGGYTASYPRRYGDPRSEQVQTLDEIQKPIWDEYNAARNKTGAKQGAFWDEQVPGIEQHYLDSGLSPQQAASAASVRQSWADHGGAEQTWNYLPQDQAKALAAQYQDITDVGPNWQQYQQRAQALADPFNQNQLRTQQAYDSMSGWNQQNGIIGPDYINPNFGQVNGQKANGIAQIPGVGTDWLSALSRNGSTAPTAGGDWSGMFGASNGMFGNGTGQAPRWGL